MKMCVLSFIFRFVQKTVFPFSLFCFFLKLFKKIRTLWLISLFKKADSSCRFGKIGRLLGADFISLGKCSGFDDFFYSTVWTDVIDSNTIPEIVIGSNCSFGAFNHITCAKKISIGNNCLTGKWVTISDNNHGSTSIEDLTLPPLKRHITSKGAVLIEDDVWIGDKVSILSGVTIGHNSVIAANSVVTKSVPPYCVVAGNPAVVVKRIA